jgi:hypothetical protein
MRSLMIALFLTFAVALPRAEAQQDDIRDVITSQIEAFKLDDFATAFTFAHPNIQRIFRTPENFGRMVTQGYPMVWRPEDVDYLDLRSDGGRTLQDVRITDAQGRVFLLEYTMAQTPMGWRIAGVRILEADALSA